MKRISWTNLLTWAAITVLVAAFWITMIMLAMTCIPSTAHAQIGGEVFSERSSVRPHGRYITGWNTTGTMIPDGTLVMADTAGVTSQPQVAIGKGFKTWSHSTTFGYAQTILGVLMGNCEGYSMGRIMVQGLHPWVKVDATAIPAKSLLRPSLISTTNGAMAAFPAADTTTITTAGSNMRRPIIGIFQRYANTDSLRGYVYINMGGMR